MVNSSTNTNYKSLLEKALLKLDEMQSKLAAAEGTQNGLMLPRRMTQEPIAIIGMSCRFPGGAIDPEKFWQLLRQGKDAITEVPQERWNIEEFFDPNPDAPGKMYSRYGGFLEQVDQFDAQFFGISPREAIQMDPQQRLLLEVSWEALEKAGLTSKQEWLRQTGVFVGITTNDYSRLMMLTGINQIDAYYLTGHPLNAMAGRISYTLGLQGPCVALDTACSSSLVSVHLACQSLRNRECAYALAGGVNLILSPDNTVALSKSKMLSPDGQCKTFDAAADGFVRGEGCGILVLKRLCDAQKDKDNILAMIVGSAVNQDGASSGFTVPNKVAQEALLREVLTKANVKPSEIDYVEAHGTGTKLGDPIEVKALAAVLGEGRDHASPLKIGSVKTNVGHLESAAGIAGLMKIILSLQHEEIPPHLHFQQPNPHIDWSRLPVSVTSTLTPWTRGQKRRIAGVSSFGASGTNAHILLEEAPVTVDVKGKNFKGAARPLHLLTLSAKTNPALQQLAHQYEQHLRVHPHLAFEDVSFTTNTGRNHFHHRLTVVAATSTEAAQKLEAIASSEQKVSGVSISQVERIPASIVAFLFTGQGSQYINMGRQLYKTEPTFRRTLERCDQILRPYLDQSLLSVLYPPSNLSSPLDETAYTQPALFAVEYALFELWQSWGIKPSIVMGHSVGEYVAACAAGVFSLEDGLKLIAHRGRLIQSLPRNGGMVAIRASESQVQPIIQPYKQQVTFAAINGPANVVISGERQAIQAVCASLEGQGIKVTPLRVSHAFHSPLMEPMLGEFGQIASEITYSQPRINLISNLTGQMATAEIATPEYWCHHIRLPVKFAASMQTLAQQGCEIFVEIGPKPTLLGMGRSYLAEGEGVWLPSLRPGREDWQQMLESLSTLYVSGVTVDWKGFHQGYSHTQVALPTYPFQRQRYWIETSDNHGHSQAEAISQEHLQTPIVHLLHQGNTQQLAQYVETAAQLSAEEVKLLPKLLEVLVQQHQQQKQAATIQDWLYKITWQPQPHQFTGISSQEPSSWLVLADCKGIGQTLAHLLQTQGQRCFLVYAGESYQAQEDGTWSLNPYNSNDFQKLLQEVVETTTLPLRGVVHLWCLDEPDLSDNVSTLQVSQSKNCGSVLYLLQALAQNKWSQPPRLSLVTQGAQAIDTEPVLLQVQSSVLWGLGRVIALEHPELHCLRLDLDSSAEQHHQVANLLVELLAQDKEDQVAYRRNVRYVARLVQLGSQTSVTTVPESPKIRKIIRKDSCYLITGGLGSLGLKVAHWMVEQGAEYLVLTGRRGASKAVQQEISKLEQAGAQILVTQADVSSQEDVSRLLKNINNLMPTLRGIVHAAGILQDSMLLGQTWESFNQVMAPKVTGAWNLHTLTQDIELDFFVCFSSVSALLGSPGQGNYAAANAFMDALVHYRRALGLPGISINWGPWGDTGMAAALNNREQTRWAKQGVRTISIVQGLQILEKILEQDVTQIGVLPVDWSQFLEQLPQSLEFPLLEAFASQVKQAQPSKSEFRQQLEVAPVRARQKLLMAHVHVLIAKILNLKSADDINPQQDFSDMGMDSLMAMELRNSLQNSLGCSILPSLAFDYPTVEMLVEYLVGELFSTQSSEESHLEQKSNPKKQVITPQLELENLSDSEAEALLISKLKLMRD